MLKVLFSLEHFSYAQNKITTNLNKKESLGMLFMFIYISNARG